MKIGMSGTGLVSHADVGRIVQHASTARDDGFSSYALAEHPTGGFDALTVLSLVGQRVPDIELATAIVPTYPRHPMVLAGQALTVADSMDNDLTLGIGLSHQSMMDTLGIGFEKPIRHLREYLSILMPLIRDGEVDYKGETLAATVKLFQPPSKNVQVIAAALGAQALGVAGRLCDGTTLAWVGPRTVKEHIVPRISDSAAKANRPAPRVIATLPVCVTGNEAAVRAEISKRLNMYTQLPSYQAMFEREGADAPGDVAIVGSAEAVRDGLGQMADAGVTDFTASEFYLTPHEKEATRELLKTALQSTTGP